MLYEKYVSDYLNKGIKGHFNYEFVDVIVNDDNLLFIDPILIETSEDQWSKDAKALIQSFFDAFFEAYNEKDELKRESCCPMLESRMEHVLVMEEEIMVRVILLKDCLIFFTPLEKLIQEISTMKKQKIYRF